MWPLEEGRKLGPAPPGSRRVQHHPPCDPGLLRPWLRPSRDRSFCVCRMRWEGRVLCPGQGRGVSPPVPSLEWASPSPSQPARRPAPPGPAELGSLRSWALCAGHESFLPPEAGRPPARTGLLVGESHLFWLWPLDGKTGGEAQDRGARSWEGAGASPGLAEGREAAASRLCVPPNLSSCPRSPGALSVGLCAVSSGGRAGSFPCLHRTPWGLPLARGVRGCGLSDVIRLVACLVLRRPTCQAEGVEPVIQP